jgi:glucokinase
MAGDYPILVADVGGTHARFGLVHGKGQYPANIQTLPGRKYSSLGSALDAYLSSVGGKSPNRGCIAVAGPVEPGQFILTNRPEWNASLSALRAAHRLDELDVINDFQALAAALPLIEPNEISPIGEPSKGEARGPLVVVGPGTGLGVGASINTPSGWQAVPGEGGHVELASADPRARAAIAHVASRYGRVSAERFLSGPGLQLLHLTLGSVDGAVRDPLDAAEIGSRASAGNAEALDTVAIFFRLLAGFAGDVALMYGARGGVFLGGGVTTRMKEFIDPRMFRKAFENKGRLRPFLAAIPTSLIASDTLALRGCAAHLDGIIGQAERNHA